MLHMQRFHIGPPTTLYTCYVCIDSNKKSSAWLDRIEKSFTANVKLIITFPCPCPTLACKEHVDSHKASSRGAGINHELHQGSKFSIYSHNTRARNTILPKPGKVKADEIKTVLHSERITEQIKMKSSEEWTWWRSRTEWRNCHNWTSCIRKGMGEAGNNYSVYHLDFSSSFQTISMFVWFL